LPLLSGQFKQAVVNFVTSVMERPNCIDVDVCKLLKKEPLSWNPTERAAENKDEGISDENSWSQADTCRDSTSELTPSDLLELYKDSDSNSSVPLLPRQEPQPFQYSGMTMDGTVVDTQKDSPNKIASGGKVTESTV